MTKICVTADPKAREVLTGLGFTTDGVESLAREYIQRLRIPGTVTGISIKYFYDRDPDTGGCAWPGLETEIHFFINLMWGSDELRSVLMHELAHLQRWVLDLAFERPPVVKEWSCADYYANSRSELEALAWEVAVNRDRYSVLREAMELRLKGDNREHVNLEPNQAV